MSTAGSGHSASAEVLTVEGLKTYFYLEDGVVPAVDGVSFALKRGSTLALVGESGCGKTVTAYSILRLVDTPGKTFAGRVVLHTPGRDDIDILSLDEGADALYDIRGGRIGMIFQEPMTALSPVHTIGNQLCEAVTLHQRVPVREARSRAIDMLGRAGIPAPEARMKQYPFELSGGMRQRVMIAMALVGRPDLLIADEPTTALDVTIQAQILGLIKRLQRDTGVAVLLITHDLGVVAQAAEEVAVMYLGRIVERGSVRAVLKTPRHPYTAGLLKSLPTLGSHDRRLSAIAGSVPSLLDRPRGCPFHPRCPYAEKGRCNTGEPPPLSPLPGDRATACLRAEEIRLDVQ